MRRLATLGQWLVTGVFLLAIAPFFVVPYAAAVGAFGWIGRTLLPLTPAARRIRDNLALVRPQFSAAQRRAVARGVGDNFGRVLMEYIRMAALAPRRDLRRATGLEHLRAAMAAGRGAVLVSAHFGSWEAVRLAARDAGVEVGIIYRPFNNDPFNRVSHLRIRLAGEPVLYKGGPGMKAMVRHLRGGGAILILLDQRLGDGETMPFLGQPARTATAVAALAQRSGAALIPACGRRAADGLSVDVSFEPPVQAPDARAAMAAINARYEAWIDADPGQWFWLHRRWKPLRPEPYQQAPRGSPAA